MVDTSETIRERIMAAMEAHFKAQKAGAPGPDPYSFTWSVVDRAEISDISHGKGYTLAIFDETEVISPGVSTLDGVTSKTLTVTCSFHSMLEAKMRPSTEGNRIIGEIIRRMLEDETYGGLAIWIKEAGNDLNIQNSIARQISGEVIFNVFYRHSRRDPRKEIC